MQIYNEHGNPIKACNKDGEEIPVIHTLQADNEWQQEFSRVERYRKCCMAESVIIVFLSLIILFKEDI